MRIHATIPHPKYRIVVYSQENHFYIEIEAGPMKQCYKLPKERASNIGDIQKWLDEDFLQRAHSIFENMYINHKDSINRNL
jgi:hypothetical protein